MSYLTHQVCDEAREAFPERFTGKTDQEIINEIAGVVQRAEKTAQGATNTMGGKADTSDQTVSASILH